MAYDAEKQKKKDGLQASQQDIFWPHRQRFFETVFVPVPTLAAATMPECLWMFIPILLPVPGKLNEADPLWLPGKTGADQQHIVDTNGCHTMVYINENQHPFP